MTLAVATVSKENWVIAQLEASVAPALDGVPAFVENAPDEVPAPRVNQAMPYITVRVISTADLYYLGGRRAATRSTIEVTGWGEAADYARLEAIGEVIDAELQAKRGPYADIFITSCIRAAEVNRSHTEGNRKYTQLGGEYVIRASTD